MQKTYHSFKEKYDAVFGFNTYNKLLEAQKQYCDDKYLRFNKNKINFNELNAFLTSNRIKYEKTFIDNCLKIKKTFFSLSSSIPYLTGCIYMQDIASQIPVLCINFDVLESNAKDRKIQILDMAAAPGSKTTQIADILSFKKIPYVIDAIEPDQKRIEKLVNNVQIQGCKNVKFFNCSAQNFKTDKKYDIILLDAPCSGNLIGDKNWLKKRSINDIIKKSQIQKELLLKAYDLLKKGGTMIYSTCSIEPEENEMNIQYITKIKHDLIEEKIDIKIPFDTKSMYNMKSLRFMPHISKTQGFFVSKLVKKN